MKVEELVREARALGAKVEPIEKYCQFQVIGQSILKYCKKKKEFGINLGSAGGPAIACKGYSPATGSHVKEGVTVIEYPEPKTCPYFVEEGGIMGWKIFLPN